MTSELKSVGADNSITGGSHSAPKRINPADYVLLWSDPKRELTPLTEALVNGPIEGCGDSFFIVRKDSLTT